MKKLILIGALALAFVVPSLSQAQQTTTAPRIIDMSLKNGVFTPTGQTPYRFTPVLVRQGAVEMVGVARLGAAGMLAVSASMLYDKYKQYPDLFPQVSGYLASKGYSVNPQTRVYNYDSIQIECTPGSTTGNCENAFKAALGATFDEYRVFSTNGAKTADQAATGYCCGFSAPTYSGVWNCSQGGITISYWGGSSAYSLGGCGGCQYLGKKVIWYNISGAPAGDYTTVHKLKDVTYERIKDIFNTDTQDTNQTDAFRKAYQDIESAARDAMRNGDSTPGSSTETIDKIVQDQYKTGVGTTFMTNLNNTANTANTQGTDVSNQTVTNKNLEDAVTAPSTGSGGSSGAPICGVAPLPPCDVTGSWNDTANTPSDLSNTNIDTNENTTVIGSDNGTKTDEQKTLLQGYFTTLMTAVNGLVSKIMTEVNRFVGSQGTGSCNVGGVSVFGGTWELNMCSVDLSGWRAGLIAVFGILAAMALVTGWRR